MFIPNQIQEYSTCRRGMALHNDNYLYETHFNTYSHVCLLTKNTLFLTGQINLRAHTSEEQNRCLKTAVICEIIHKREQRIKARNPCGQQNWTIRSLYILSLQSCGVLPSVSFPVSLSVSGRFRQSCWPGGGWQKNTIKLNKDSCNKATPPPHMQCWNTSAFRQVFSITWCLMAKTSYKQLQSSVWWQSSLGSCYFPCHKRCIFSI